MARVARMAANLEGEIRRSGVYWPRHRLREYSVRLPRV